MLTRLIRALRLSSAPWRSVLPKFLKYPNPVCSDATKRMSLRLSARNQPALHCSLLSAPLRTPASTVRVTTCFNGGSPASTFGSLHGEFGSAQPSSIDVGALLP